MPQSHRNATQNAGSDQIECFIGIDRRPLRRELHGHDELAVIYANRFRNRLGNRKIIVRIVLKADDGIAFELLNVPSCWINTGAVAVDRVIRRYDFNCSLVAIYAPSCVG